MKRLTLVLATAALAAGCAQSQTATSAAPGAVVLAQEPAIPLDNAQAVRQLQERLTEHAAYFGPIDGVWSPATRVALERYQLTHGFDVTGWPNAATMAGLGMEPVAGTNVAFTAPPPDPAVTEAIKQRLWRAGLYTGPVNGRWGLQAIDAVAAFQATQNLKPTGALDPATMASLGLSSNGVTTGYGG